MGAIIRDGIWYGGATAIDNELSTTSENPVQNKIITNNIYQIFPPAIQYNNTATYNINDYCIYNNILYKCINNISTPEEFNTNNWVAISIISDLTNISNNIVNINNSLTTVDANGNIYIGTQLVRKILTQVEYDALTTKDPKVDYCIIEST